MIINNKKKLTYNFWQIFIIITLIFVCILIPAGWAFLILVVFIISIVKFFSKLVDKFTKKIHALKYTSSTHGLNENTNNKEMANDKEVTNNTESSNSIDFVKCFVLEIGDDGKHRIIYVDDFGHGDSFILSSVLENVDELAIAATSDNNCLLSFKTSESTIFSYKLPALKNSVYRLVVPISNLSDIPKGAVIIEEVGTENYEILMNKQIGDNAEAEAKRNEENLKRKISQERERIAQKIKERQRLRDIEKSVRQELIDSGELFGEQMKRPPITREVSDAVYRRDGGKCVYCGSTENIQYDHIIPFSKGGATTVENLQILCQKCNLEKSNKIG